jgi:hypothetical protein
MVDARPPTKNPSFFRRLAMVTKNAKPEKSEKSEKLSRPGAASQAVRELDKPATLTELTRRAMDLFTRSGGKCDEDQMRNELKSTIRSAAMLGLVTTRRDELTIIPASNQEE